MLTRVVTLTLALAVWDLAGAGWTAQNKEPKTQVAPLAPEPPMALSAHTTQLDFHISPLLRKGGLLAQIRQSLNQLIRDTRGEKIVKLRAFVAGTGDARRVQAETAGLFTEHKLPLPVLSILQVGALGRTGEQVVIEAVVSTGRTVNPNGLGFFYGQRGSSFADALNRLKQNTEAASVPANQVVSSTCFTAYLEDFSTATNQLHALFPSSAVNIVQGVRDPLEDGVVCEAIAQLKEPPKTDIEHFGDRNTTLVRTDELVFTGLQLSFGSYLADTEQAYERLRRSAQALSPAAQAVEVNAYSVDAPAASALRKTNSLAPTLFTVHPVEGLSAMDATGGIEAILATAGK